ncbi:hypothetical protein BYT27DRAFT_7247941 [Phlegmacium glaucopus]|nr:hypothetical protein BYT27DRAFT_7247941 [Phlegmacium glaucopus]
MLPKSIRSEEMLRVIGLEKRFGHPALHAELFTPMLHKNLMPLLSEVYHGKINSDRAKVDAYGGQQMEAQLVPPALRSRNDLMYDPVMYQRDWDELDWDQRSVATTLSLRQCFADAK